MYKFFVANGQITGNIIEITGKDVNHIKNVLRLKEKDIILICDKNYQHTYECQIREMSKDNVICEILSENKNTTESNVYIHLFQGLPKAEKMETIIQKTIEVGVSEITPVIMNRCVVKLDEKNKISKMQRWQKIAEVAAKQCKRDMIPQINMPLNLKNIYENLENYDIVLVAYEEEYNVTIKQILKQIHNDNGNNIRIAIIIGPEGGIEKEEIENLKKNVRNTKIVSLGKRILRTETAPIVMSTIIMYELEGE